MAWGFVVALCLIATGQAEVTRDIRAEIKAKCGLVPIGAVVIDGAIATKDEMQEANHQVKIFMEASDLFQDCVLRVAESFKDKVTHQLAPKDQAAVVAIVDQSQREKESLGNAYNEAVDAFKAADKRKSAPGTKPH